MEQKILEHIQSQPWACSSITREMDRYIRGNFTPIDAEDKENRKWYKVYRVGTDSKFNHYMICLETKEYRPSTQEEFYTGKYVYEY